MNESDLSRDVSDWMLPLAHEQYWSGNFMAGGRTFLDVGAHVGTWTLRLAPLFERVFCFEPDARAYDVLCKNIRAAGLRNVVALPVAVADKSGKVRFNLYPNPSTNSMFGPEDTLRHGETIQKTIEVDAVSLDEFCAGAMVNDVDFIKCDVEGAEMLVVEGGKRTFRYGQPDFFVECHGLFYDRLRRLLDPIACDVLDGGQHGLSLARHRESWPGLPPPNFRVYPSPTSPTLEEMEALRRLHGLDVKMPTSGWLSEGGT